jgi:hypothetical protein
MKKHNGLTADINRFAQLMAVHIISTGQERGLPPISIVAAAARMLSVYAATERFDAARTQQLLDHVSQMVQSDLDILLRSEGPGP